MNEKKNRKKEREKKKKEEEEKGRKNNFSSVWEGRRKEALWSAKIQKRVALLDSEQLPSACQDLFFSLSLPPLSLSLSLSPCVQTLARGPERGLGGK